MPVPQPKPKETKSDFMSRCIEFEAGLNPKRPPEQVVAICSSAWKESEAMNDKNLLYEADFTEAKFERENFTIRNVALLGPESSNKRRYTDKCMQGAVSLFENVKAFVDHPSTEEQKTGRRSVRNLAGKYTNARLEDGRIKADATLLPNENGKLYMDIAENLPDIAGNSQNARGLWHKKDGVQIVEQITFVDSVDLVASPATTHGMFESESNSTGVNDMDWNDVTATLLLAHRPDIRDAIFNEGQKSRDDEVGKLTEDNKGLKLKVDEFEVKEAAVKKAAKVDELVEKEKLPKEAVTDVFKESLMAADDEKVQKLIADRKALYESVKGGVKNMGGGGDLKDGKEPTLQESKAALFG